MKSKTVRIAVVVAADGAWECAGWGYDNGPEDDSEILSVIGDGAVVNEHKPNHVLWVRAKVPIPASSPAEIIAEVEP